jgi:hypothetical protein
MLGYPAENLLSKIETVQLPLWFGKFRTPFESIMIDKIKDEVSKQFGFCVPVKDYYWLLYGKNGEIDPPAPFESDPHAPLQIDPLKTEQIDPLFRV